MELINFAIIIDGEVASNMTFPPQIPLAPKLEAIYSSSPIFVRTEERIEEGSIWDGERFIAPS
jgi:hypothetical protein